MSRGNRSKKSMLRGKRTEVSTRHDSISGNRPRNVGESEPNVVTSAEEKKSTLHHDVAEDYIYTTRSKLHVKIGGIYERLTTGRDWISPLSLFVTLVGLILSFEFKRDMPIYKIVLLLLLIICMTASFIYLWWRVYKIKTTKKMSVADVVDEIINSGTYYEKYDNRFTPEMSPEKTNKNNNLI